MKNKIFLLLFSCVVSFSSYSQISEEYQLKEANNHLSKKNVDLVVKNKELKDTLDTTKTKVEKVIKKLKSQK